MVSCRFVESINVVEPAQWNAVLLSQYPFLRHEFLYALERSGATTRDSGWQVQHLLLEQGGQLVGHLPLYLKYHSYGEYVFDWSWADAYRGNGLAYYPKLLSAIPYTPATGPRLSLLPAFDVPEVREQVMRELLQRCEQQASSLHILFPGQGEETLWGGLSRRVAAQYHWFNRDYADFDAFLDEFSSRKRKSLRRERRRVVEQGITLRCIEGADINESLWTFFYHCYQMTYAKRSGHGGYLNESFFREVGTKMPDNLLMVLAERDGRPVAAALNFKDGQTLYGRYWGCLEELECLHFEACYYQGIDYCIRNGLQRFDPGAQGEHKISRGFEPVETCSRHWVVDERFRTAIDNFLREETVSMAAYIEDARELLPFKRG
jgi:predicted N-acyltransferase